MSESMQIEEIDDEIESIIDENEEGGDEDYDEFINFASKSLIYDNDEFINHKNAKSIIVDSFLKCFDFLFCSSPSTTMNQSPSMDKHHRQILGKPSSHNNPITRL